MSDDYGFVARPARGQRGLSALPIKQIVETATNGQAVSIPLAGRRPNSLVSLIHALFRAPERSALGLRIHTKLDGENVIIWATPRGEAL